MNSFKRWILLSACVALSAPALSAAERCSVDEGYGEHDCIYVYEVRDNGEWMTYECNDGDSGAYRVPNGTTEYQCSNYGN